MYCTFWAVFLKFGFKTAAVEVNRNIIRIGIVRWSIMEKLCFFKFYFCEHSTQVHGDFYCC